MNRHKPEVLIFESEEEITRFLLEKWREIGEAALRERGLFTLALSGGRTPLAFYRELAGLKDKDLWAGTHIFLADERLVPPDHQDSNYRALAQTFLDRVPIPAQNRHPVPVSEEAPENSALKYDEELRSFFRLFPGEPPVFDLILLGIGADGHTASLFPGDRALTETDRLAVAVSLDAQRHSRVTLTFRVINSAQNVIVLATGEGKSEVIRRLLKEHDSSIPAARVRPEHGRLLFVLDRSAASQLE